MDSFVIAWNDGTSDNIYLSLTGDSVDVTSDANWSGADRQKVLTFETTTGGASASLTVTQSVGGDVLIAYNGAVISYNNKVISYGNNS